MEVLNLDPVEATKTCMTPMSTLQRFYFRALISPLLVMMTSIMVAPLWNCLRAPKSNIPGKRKRCPGLPQKLWEKLQSPSHIKSSHIKRTIVNVFLFCYMPATQAAIEILICKKMTETCRDDSPELCISVLATDFSVECAGPQYFIARGTALASLAIFVVVLPVVLLTLGKSAVEKRTFNMSLRLGEIRRWFAELDADASGLLDAGEMFNPYTEFNVARSRPPGRHGDQPQQRQTSLGR